MPDQNNTRKKKLWPPLWYARETLAVTFWIAAIVKFLIFDFDIYLANKYVPESAWLLQYKFFAILAFVATIAVLCSRRWFRFLFLYIVFYPFIFVFYLLVWACFHWPVLIAFSPGIYSLVTKYQTNLIWSSLAILSAFSITVFRDEWLILISMLVLAAFLCQHYWSDIRRAFSPSSVFADLATIAKNLHRNEAEKFSRQLTELSLIASNDVEFAKKKQQLLTNAYMRNSFVKFITEKFHVVEKSRMFELYLIYTVLFSLFLTLMVFGFEYVGLSKIDTEAFKPHSPLGVLEAMGFSINTMTSSSVSTVQAVSGLSQTICYLEILFGVLLGIISFGMIKGVVRERYREDLQLLITELEHSEGIIAATLSSELQLTHEQLEEHLLESSLDMINGWRYVRGLEALSKPELQVESAIDKVPKSESPKQEDA